MAGRKESAKSERRSKSGSKGSSSKTSRARMNTPSQPISKPLTALEESNILYEASIADQSKEKKPTRATETVRSSLRSWRSRRARMSAPSRPIPKPSTALEESNAQYEASIARAKEEKARKAQPECPICCVEFSNDQRNSQHKTYSCPNAACNTLFCESCKASTLEHDYRCPFCRCKLDGATLDRPRWRGDETDEADLLAAANGENELDAAAEANAELLLTLRDSDIMEDLILDGVIEPDARPIPTISRFPSWRGQRR